LPTNEQLLDALFLNAKYAMDVIYGRITPFLKKAQETHLEYQDGEAMLLNQGVIAFNLFYNNSLNEEKIKNAMQKALRLSS
jgi:shikimate dehydrogenase